MRRRGLYSPKPVRSVGDWVGLLIGWTVVALVLALALGLLILGVQKVWGEIV